MQPEKLLSRGFRKSSGGGRKKENRGKVGEIGKCRLASVSPVFSGEQSKYSSRRVRVRGSDDDKPRISFLAAPQSRAFFPATLFFSFRFSRIHSFPTRRRCARAQVHSTRLQLFSPEKCFIQLPELHRWRKWVGIFCGEWGIKF